MKEAKIYTLPENYIERQRIMKALHDPKRELVMWYYRTPPNKDKELLFAVYLNPGSTMSINYFDTETLQYQGVGIMDKSGMDYKMVPDVYFLIDRLKRNRGCVTDMFGYAVGVTSKPPKPEGKIINFPAKSSKAYKTYKARIEASKKPDTEAQANMEEVIM
jgi:hypothetical protein